MEKLGGKRGLGFKASALARELYLSQPAVSMRGNCSGNLAKEKRYIFSMGGKL
jgi:hypothetical protein